MFRNALEPWHLLILVAVLVLIFGSKKLPDTARALGKSMRILKSETKAVHDDGASNEPHPEPEPEPAPGPGTLPKTPPSPAPRPRTTRPATETESGRARPWLIPARDAARSLAGRLTSRCRAPTPLSAKSAGVRAGAALLPGSSPAHDSGRSKDPGEPPALGPGRADQTTGSGADPDQLLPYPSPSAQVAPHSISGHDRAGTGSHRRRCPGPGVGADLADRRRATGPAVTSSASDDRIGSERSGAAGAAAARVASKGRPRDLGTQPARRSCRGAPRGGT
ncbi:Sec-independent protein translocase subunit TatA [Actinacidiphila sp. bgisy160]|uniref:Sec-independent protein translocase subunit TatA n=1 Tax=Actinacidiphila sp. bgisy160 TaxID=3413796 RepID=UPI003D70AA24